MRIIDLVGIYSDSERDPRARSIAMVVEVHVRGELRAADISEISEARAFAPGELPAGPMAYGSDGMLRDYLEGRTVIA